ncbi:MAG: ATP-dependent DNA helicase RecG [Chloroflexota bacterium]
MRRVLSLERRQGYRNRAAAGGLERFVRQQVGRGAGELRDLLPLLEAYQSASASERAAAIEAAMRSLESAAPSLPPLGQQTEPPLPAPRSPLAAPLHAPADLARAIEDAPGMRKPMSQALRKQGVETIREALYYFPRLHYDYRSAGSAGAIRPGEMTTLLGIVRSVHSTNTRRKIKITTLMIETGAGSVAVRWFNQPYIGKQMPVGSRVAISGEAEMFEGRLYFKPRDHERLDEGGTLTHADRVVPIYPLGGGLAQRSLRGFMRRLVDEYAGSIEDYLPGAIVEQFDLMALPQAVSRYHFPDDLGERDQAQHRLAFDELFLIQMGLLARKREQQKPVPGTGIQVDQRLSAELESGLPFSLTEAQQRVIGEILHDIERDIPMNRLVQGDVGSGKTVVAAAALLQMVRAGKQAALMAPTEILAEQHHRTLSELLGPLDITCTLLVGSTPAPQRRDLNEWLSRGSPQIVVGTHALIQESVEFASLGLAIVDEQHRFGVEQRAVLQRKGMAPHLLTMTATPIPRTLAMTLYGDLDISLIDQMPPGRLPVHTSWVRSAVEAYAVVRREIEAGNQAFVICPVIEESVDEDMSSVLAEHQSLQKFTFPDEKIGLLHGRMKPADKEAALRAFRDGECQILVATSVVEVGIDIPAATVIVVRDAHRFGLAQLHQFRGRVGRRGDQGWCLLVSNAEGDAAGKRLQALEASTNGFDLAEVDLKLRGPGQFWGTHQSGFPELRVGRLSDLRTLELSRKVASRILESDPDLSHPQHQPLRAAVADFWSSTLDPSVRD